MLYLFVFEDGTAIQKMDPITEEDREAIKDGLVNVFYQRHTGEFVSLNKNGGPEEIMTIESWGDYGVTYEGFQKEEESV